MGRRKKAMGEGNICPHCNVEMEYENSENGEIAEFWWECKKCGRSYDEDKNDITEYEFMDISQEGVEMGDKEVLCTYKYNGNYTFDWLDENEFEDWIEENKDIYTDIEVLRIKVTDTLYQSE